MTLPIRLTLTVLGAFFLTHFLGRWYIPFLHKLHFGQTIYDLGPAHQSKQGTPIMGGMMAALAALVFVLLLHGPVWHGFWDASVGLLGVSLLSMLVGFADDFIKSVKKRHDGLTPWQKIAGQVVVAVAFACYCAFNPSVGTAIRLPFTSAEWDLGIFYIPLMTLVIIFMVNSSNLLDGLDGLLSTTTSIGNTGWAALALMTCAAAAGTMAGDNADTCAVFALAVVGGTLGFLRYNRYPAKCFQGDSGSMFIGGTTVGLALLLRQPLLMILIDVCMLMSSISVILQRYYFKLTHGKRIFKMSPVHHHFEKCGWSETRIVAVFTAVTAVASLIGLLAL